MSEYVSKQAVLERIAIGDYGGLLCAKIARETISTTTEPTGAEHDDDLLGKCSKERCPKCGANLLENKRGDKWCSFIGCDYSIDASEKESRTE